MVCPVSSQEDIALMKAIAAQDQTAFSKLYDRYARVMYSLAFKILGSVEESEEVVLDVFSKVWKSSESFDAARGRVDGWLFMMTRSRCLDRLRSKQRLLKVQESSQRQVKTPETEVPNPPEQYLFNQERRERVKRALDQIPENQRSVLELAYFEGLSQSQIAKTLAISLGTVKTRTRLGLNKLIFHFRKILGLRESIIEF